MDKHFCFLNRLKPETFEWKVYIELTMLNWGLFVQPSTSSSIRKLLQWWVPQSVGSLEQTGPNSDHGPPPGTAEVERASRGVTSLEALGRLLELRLEGRLRRSQRRWGLSTGGTSASASSDFGQLSDWAKTWRRIRPEKKGWVSVWQNGFSDGNEFGATKSLNEKSPNKKVLPKNPIKKVLSKKS